MPELEQLRTIEEHLRREDPDLARALDAFVAGAAATPAPRDPVAHGVAVALAVVVGLLLLGWAASGDAGLLTGAWLVATCSPVVWLVRLARCPRRSGGRPSAGG